MENMSELYDIKEMSGGTVPLSFNLTDLYQQEDSILMGKIKCAEYQTGYFFIGRNTIELVMYKDKK